MILFISNNILIHLHGMIIDQWQVLSEINLHESDSQYLLSTPPPPTFDSYFRIIALIMKGEGNQLCQILLQPPLICGRT